MFLDQGWYLHKEKENSFLILSMANFSLTATSFRQAFLLSDRMMPFFSSLSLFYFFSFSNKDFFPLLIFP